MSCIRFNTPAQREQWRRHAPARLTPEQAAALHPAPAVTESKLRRLRLLAADPNPRIRQSAAAARNTPADALAELAHDEDSDVRVCLARNRTAPVDVLRALATDRSPRVRGWLAVNDAVPADVLDALADDADETVRALVRWKHRVERENAAV